MQIIYTLGSISPKLLPYVFPTSHNYIGPLWDQSQPKDILIPPINCSNKKQNPLKIAWELTIHKNQGLTLTRSTIEIGNNECQGLTFIAMSCTIVLLRMLCKDERHFICMTSKKGRGTPSFFVPFTLKVSTLNP